MREVSRRADGCRTRTGWEPEFAGKGHAGGAGPAGNEQLVAAIVGDTVGYEVGRHLGTRLLDARFW